MVNGTSTKSPSGEKPKENILKEEAQSKTIKGDGGIFFLLRSKLANQIVEYLVTVTIGGVSLNCYQSQSVIEESLWCYCLFSYNAEIFP